MSSTSDICQGPERLKRFTHVMTILNLCSSSNTSRSAQVWQPKSSVDFRRYVAIALERHQHAHVLHVHAS